MDAIRCQLIEDVEDAVKAGEITSFWQYPELLQQYDDHPPLVDCMGCVPTHVYDEDGAHADIFSGELLGDGIAEDPLENTIAQETKAFEENPGASQAASSSALNTSEKHLAASAGSAQADFDEAAIPETSVVSTAAPFTGALQAGSDGVKAHALPCATSSLFDASNKPPGAADAETTKRAKAVDALMSAAATLREAGEEMLAASMDNQVHRRLREARRERSKMCEALRGVTLRRKRQIVEARAEDMAKRARLDDKKLELKLATEHRLAATALAKQESALAKSKEIESKDGRLAAAKAHQLAAKEKEAEAKLAKEQQQLQRQDAQKNQDQLRRTFAGCYAKSIVKFIADKDHGENRRDAILNHIKTLGKRPWIKAKLTPEFWNARDKAGLRCMSGKDNFGNFFDPEPIYASEGFSWELWCHSSPKFPASLPRMRHYVERTFPGYEQLCGARFPMEDLLRDCFYNADVTFLTAAWLYSSLVSNDVFPCGLRQWPPPVALWSSSVATASG